MVMVKAMTIGVSIQLAKDKAMDYENTWVCSCGARNPDSANNCLRCGA